MVVEVAFARLVGLVPNSWHYQWLAVLAVYPTTFIPEHVKGVVALNGEAIWRPTINALVQDIFCEVYLFVIAKLIIDEMETTILLLSA